jgi:hypothetical protein
MSVGSNFYAKDYRWINPHLLETLPGFSAPLHNCQGVCSQNPGVSPVARDLRPPANVAPSLYIYGRPTTLYRPARSAELNDARQYIRTAMAIADDASEFKPAFFWSPS